LAVFNIQDFLFDVSGLLDDSVLDFNEAIDGLLAFFDVLIDGKREPIMVLGTLVHPFVQLVNLFFEELLLDWFQIAES